LEQCLIGFRQISGRRSLRGQIHTELSSQELQKATATEGITVKELKKATISIPTSILNSFSSKKAAS
jgi:hypothetical protein